MKRRPNLFDTTVTLGVTMLCAAIILPWLSRSKSDGPMPVCLSNLQQIYVSLRLYAEDNERLPPVALNNVKTSQKPFRTPFGWADALSQSSGLSNSVLQCPQDTTPISLDGTQRGFTDYWINRNLSECFKSEIPAMLEKDKRMLLLCGEGNDGVDDSSARYARVSIPPRWKTSPNSPLFRHEGRAFYLGLDGQVRVFAPEQIAQKIRMK